MTGILTVDRRPRQTPRDVTKSRAPLFNVDRHADKRIDDRNRVGAGFLAGAGKFADVRDVGREFDPERQALGRLASLSGHVVGVPRVFVEMESSSFHVRTGDVQFQRRNARAVIEKAGNFKVILQGESHHVHNHVRLVLAQDREFLRDEFDRADVLPSNGVEHARRGFVDSRRRVPFDRFHGNALHDNSADRVEVHEMRELDSVGEGPAGGHHRVLEPDFANLHRHLHRLINCLLLRHF